MILASIDEREHGFIDLIPLGDIHIGSPTSRASEALDLISKAGSNARFLFLGDVIDNALRDSVSDTYKQTGSPGECLRGFIQLLNAAGDRLWGVVSGNHEDRTTRRVGVDLLELICSEREIPYSSGMLVVDVSVGRRAPSDERGYNYLIVAGHGSGGGRTPGGRVNAANRLANVVPGADIYLTGHTHQPATWKDSYFYADRHNKRIMQRDRHHLVVPAWLGYEEYAEKRFYSPSAFMEQRIFLNGAQRQIRIEIG